MKKILIVAIIGVFAFSCQQEKRTDYLINGNAKGVYNGVRAYLKVKDERGREINKDTAIIFNEKFSFDGSIETPALRYITVNSVNGSFPFILENSEINVDINKVNIATSQISGSETHNDLEAYERGIKAIQNEIKPTKLAYRRVMRSQNSPEKDSLLVVLTALDKKLSDAPFTFIDEHTDRYYSLILIDQQSKKPGSDIARYMAAFESLSDDVIENPTGLRVKTKLEALQKVHQAKTSLDIGKVAPNFEAPNPDGNILSLADIKGKVTIIDFWASWCGPCRRENPNVVRIYNQYHDQGLEIIGVSLDGQSRQADPKKAWLAAIKKDNLTWHHVSNLNYFNDPIAQLYAINSIPATYILDSEGKIVAKNLRGKSLELKVKELLSK